MEDRAAEYRAHAAHCRRLADGFVDDSLRQALLIMAAEFEEEAARADGEIPLTLSMTPRLDQ
jgi:hypothetical protein